MAEFKDAGKLILGICNGFQVLIKSGVLLDNDDAGTPATLTWNDSGKFEDRWTQLNVRSNKSIFLDGIDSMYLPIAHAEGKFVTRDSEVLSSLGTAGQLVLRYVPLGSTNGDPDGEVPYPDNPNGSMGNVAGACDATGRVLGMMPHLERHIDPTTTPAGPAAKPPRPATVCRSSSTPSSSSAKHNPNSKRKRGNALTVSCAPKRPRG